MSLQDVRNVFISKTNNNPIIADISMGGNEVIHIGEPVSDTDAATKRYADSETRQTDIQEGTQNEDLNINQRNIINIKNDNSLNNIATLKYVEEYVTQKQLTNHLHVYEKIINLKCNSNNTLVNKKFCLDNYYTNTGSVDISHNWDMGGHPINWLSPLMGAGSSALTQQNVKKLFNAHLPTTGGTLNSDLDIGNNRVSNVKAPTADNSLVTKDYMDTKSLAGEINGDINLNNHQIIRLKTATSDNHAINKENWHNNTACIKSSTKLTGTVNLDSKYVISPIHNHQLTNYKYFLRTMSNYWPSRTLGGKFSKDVKINKIINLGAPVQANDMATKKYCDDRKNNQTTGVVTLGEIKYGVTPPITKNLTVQFTPTPSTTSVVIGRKTPPGVYALHNMRDNTKMIVTNTIQQPLFKYDAENNKFFLHAYNNHPLNVKIAIPTNKIFKDNKYTSMIVVYRQKFIPTADQHKLLECGVVGKSLNFKTFSTSKNRTLFDYNKTILTTQMCQNTEYLKQPLTDVELMSSVGVVIDKNDTIRLYSNSNRTPNIVSSPTVTFSRSNASLQFTDDPNIDIYGVYIYNKALSRSEMDSMMKFLWKEYDVPGYNPHVFETYPKITSRLIHPTPYYPPTVPHSNLTFKFDANPQNMILNDYDGITQYNYNYNSLSKIFTPGTEPPKLCYNPTNSQYYIAFRGSKSALKTTQVPLTNILTSNNKEEQTMFFVYKPYANDQTLMKWNTSTNPSANVINVCFNSPTNIIFNNKVGYGLGAGKEHLWASTHHKQEVNDIQYFVWNKSSTKNNIAMFGPHNATSIRSNQHPYVGSNNLITTIGGTTGIADLQIGGNWVDLYAIYVYNKSLSTAEMTNVIKFINDTYHTPIPPTSNIIANPPSDLGLKFQLVVNNINGKYDGNDKLLYLHETVNNTLFKAYNTPAVDYNKETGKYFLKLEGANTRLQSTDSGNFKKYFNSPDGKTGTIFIIFSRSSDDPDGTTILSWEPQGSTKPIELRLFPRNIGGYQWKYGTKVVRVSFPKLNILNKVYVIGIQIVNEDLHKIWCDETYPYPPQKIRGFNTGLLSRTETGSLKIGTHISKSNNVDFYGLYMFNRTLADDEMKANIEFFRREFVEPLIKRCKPPAEAETYSIYMPPIISISTHAEPIMRFVPTSYNTKVNSDNQVMELYDDVSKRTLWGSSPRSILELDSTNNRHYLKLTNSNGLFINDFDVNDIFDGAPPAMTAFMVFKPVTDTVRLIKHGSNSKTDTKSLDLFYKGGTGFSFRYGIHIRTLSTQTLHIDPDKIYVIGMRIYPNNTSLILFENSVVAGRLAKNPTQNAQFVIGGDNSTYNLYGIYIYGGPLTSELMKTIMSRLNGIYHN